MDEQLKLDRTWLCSVVFVDIVSYARQSLELQMIWKRRFNHYLAEAIQECPETDRVILDTGDGAAICFLGDPERAMFCALRLIGSLGQDETRQESPMRARVGINLGSVKLVKDINGNLNAVGDGINVGQRVMSFAHENQILVSRSFYEVASSLSDSYSVLFKYEGVHKDKHVREHTLYELHPPGSTGRATAHSGESAPAPTTFMFDSVLVARIENSLSPVVGPIARHLVKNAGRQAATPAELCRALLAFIPDKADQEKFLKGCGNILPAASAPAPAVESVASVHLEKTTFNWDPTVLERARKDLAAHIGPMARLLVDRAAAKVQTRDELYRLLAEEISSPKDRETFLKSGF